MFTVTTRKVVEHSSCHLRAVVDASTGLICWDPYIKYCPHCGVKLPTHLVGGTLSIRETWNDKKLELCNPESFEIDIAVDQELINSLSPAEFTRLSSKIALVKKASAKLAANMVKGTLKYESDNNTAEEWSEYLVDDLTDSLNYVYLMQERMKRTNG